VDKQLREFEELLLDNALLKVPNQALVEKISKGEKLWQTMHEIMHGGTNLGQFRNCLCR